MDQREESCGCAHQYLDYDNLAPVKIRLSSKIKVMLVITNISSLKDYYNSLSGPSYILIS